MEIKFIDWTLFSLVHNDKKTDKWFWITQQWYLLMYVLHNKTFEKNCFWLFIHSRKIAQLVKNGKIVQWIMYYRYVELFATKSDNPHFWRWYLYYYLGPLTVVVVASPLKKRTLILECRKFNCHLFRIFAHSAKLVFYIFILADMSSTEFVWQLLPQHARVKINIIFQFIYCNGHNYLPIYLDFIWNVSLIIP